MITNTMNAILSSRSSVILPAPLPQTVLTVVASNAANLLSWASVVGATGYTVKRGTSSGVHGTTVYSGSNLSLLDTGLSNGTTYYYIVVASFASGNSESLEVSGQPTNAFTHPQDVANCLFAYEFFRTATLFTDTAKSIPVLSNGQTLAFATDVGGAAHDATQSTVANQPTYQASGLNGNPAITGTTTAKTLTTGISNQSNANLTVIAVFKPNSAQGAVVSHNAANSFQNFWCGADGINVLPTVYTGDNSHSVLVQGLTPLGNNAAVVVFRVSNGYATLRVNGAMDGTAAANNAINTTLYTGNVTLTIGSGDYRGFNSESLSAAAAFSRDLTITEINNLTAYYANQFGITASATTYSNVVGTSAQVLAGAVNWPTNTGTSFEGIYQFHPNRIRQNGTILRVGLKTQALTGLTATYLKIWRKNGGGTYDLVGSSEDITSKLPAAGKSGWVTLGSPITGVQEGDSIGFRCEWSGGASVYNFFGASSGGFTCYTVSNSSPGSSGFAWESQTTTSNYQPFVIQMVQPYLTAIGDSLTAGHPDNYSYIESPDINSLSTTIWSVWSGLSGRTFQNAGIGGQTSVDLVNRFGTSIIDLQPSKYVHLLCGVNDISGGTITQSQYIANMTILLNTIVNLGAIPVVSKIWPWTAGTNTQMQTRDAWNSALTTLVSSYPTAILYDASSTLGQFRSGGDPGNLWDIKPALNYDGTHINATGRSAMGNYIYNIGVA